MYIKNLLTYLLIFIFSLTFTFLFLTKAIAVKAATTPDLGTAATFAVLSTTFTRNVGLTSITGDLGYTTISGSGTSSVTGTTYVPSPAQAGTDQAAALTALNAQTCDFSFGSATALNSLSQPLTPGVYCITGAASVAGIGIILSGSGTYIFRSTGALDTAAGTVVTLTDGASACNVFWTPVAATTLGANSTFMGTVIDNAGITVGNTVSWTGRALAYAETVTTDTDTITVPTCTVPTATPEATLTPTATAIPTVMPTEISSTANPLTNGGALPSEPCPNLNFVPPVIIESKRIDGDSIFISWGPYSGINTFNVRYGLENGHWLYNTNVIGFSTTINDLPLDQSIWMQVAAKNDCTLGDYGESKRIGGPSLPNAGVPPVE